MGSVPTFEPQLFYGSAPILDYDDEPQARPDDEGVAAAPGVMTLAPEAFDAAILEALVKP